MNAQSEGKDEGTRRTTLNRTSTRLTWTVTEVAELLGISRSTAYEAAHRGELPYRIIGRRMLIPRAALLRLLDETQPTEQP